MSGTEVKENRGSKDEKKSFGRDVGKLVTGILVAQAVVMDMLSNIQLTTNCVGEMRMGCMRVCWLG